MPRSHGATARPVSGGWRTPAWTSRGVGIATKYRIWNSRPTWQILARVSSNSDEERSVTVPFKAGLIEPQHRGPPRVVVIYSLDPRDLCRSLLLNTREVIIGRGPRNGLSIEGQEISRRHCQITQDESGSFFLRDLGSTNGTFVNEQRCATETVLLSPGDRIRVGRSILKFISGADVEAQFHEEIYRMTREDGLTGLLNTRYLQSRLAECALRVTGTAMCFLVVWSIRDFAKFNEDQGVVAGDLVLGELARRIKRELELRMPGPEFDLGRSRDLFLGLFLLPSESEAASLAEQIAAAVQVDPFHVDELEIRLSIGCGVALASRTGADAKQKITLDIDELLERAEQDRRRNELSSVFISYGGPDTAFAARLDGALRERGVRTFLFQNDAVPGQPLHQLMHDGVNSFDRVVLVCSNAAFERPGVLNEIEETLRRESREGGTSRLIPIAIDDAVYGPDHDPRRLWGRMRDRVIADFRMTLNDNASFEAAVERLLPALRNKAASSRG